MDATSFLAGAGIGLVELDARGVVRDVSEAATGALGSAAAASTIGELATRLGVDSLARAVRRVLDGTEHRTELTIRTGEERVLILRVCPIDAPDGGATMAVIDVALAGAGDLAGRGFVRRDELISMISHELRNPLAAIVSAVELAQAHESGASSVNLAPRILDIIDRQTMHMSKILADLLDMTRLGGDGLELDRRRCDLGDVVAESVERALRRARAQGIALGVEVGDQALPIDGDSERLGQVVDSLLANAIKYNAPGGRVDVSVRASEGRAHLEVADDGDGIAPEFIDHVFEPFAQSERGLTRLDGGMGVGLTLVRAIVEMHGGSIRCHSAGASCGATFTVELPLAGPERPCFHQVRTATGAPGVLVVEDDDDNRDLLAALLEQAGYAVLCAATGADAIAMVDSHSPAVALIDIGIPDPDGYEVARRVKRAHPDVSLVALTGYSHPDDRRRALACGFDEHLGKPIHFPSLKDVIDRFARTSR